MVAITRGLVEDRRVQLVLDGIEDLGPTDQETQEF